MIADRPVKETAFRKAKGEPRDHNRGNRGGPSLRRQRTQTDTGSGIGHEDPEVDPSRIKEPPGFDAEAEAQYWKANHDGQDFAGNDDFADYQEAYRNGYLGFVRYGNEQSFEDAEASLRREYEATGKGAPWALARRAARAAWERVESRWAEPELSSESRSPAQENL